MDAQSHGFHCPNCGDIIHVDLGRLLSAAPFYCSGCGTKFSLDPNASATALAAAEKYKVAIQKVAAAQQKK